MTVDPASAAPLAGGMLARGMRAIPGWALLLIVATGCGERTSSRPMRARPVTVLRLEEREPARETRLTGSVVPYREEKIGFEVAGRILAVHDVGMEVEGPTYDEADKLVREPSFGVDSVIVEPGPFHD